MPPRVTFRVDCALVAFDESRLENTILRVLRDHGRDEGLLSVAIVDDETIHRVNREFLEHDEPTDVISFLLEEGDGAPADDDDPFAELVISAETAAREAAERGIPPESELVLYAIHGTLHLVGYDDRLNGERARMREAERRYLDPA